MRAARVTVVVLCVCVCMCVHSYLPPHTLKLQNRDTNKFIAILESFYVLPISLKMLHSKVKHLEHLRHDVRPEIYRKSVH